jgi:hypothetical protein
MANDQSSDVWREVSHSQVIDWLISLLSTGAVSAGLVAVLAWLLKRWIAERLTADIRGETEKKLTDLKHRLDAAEAQVSAVRAAGIESTRDMFVATLSERVQAIKEIWLGVVEWKAASLLVSLISAMDEEIATGSAGHAGTQRTLNTMLDSLKDSNFLTRTNALARWRPFITARGWALFHSYHAFYSAHVAKAAILAIGNGAMVRRMWQDGAERKIVRAGAPDDIVRAYQADPVATGPRFLEFLEAELLTELQLTLAGEHSGPNATLQAAKVVALTDEALRAVQEAAGKAKVE